MLLLRGRLLIYTPSVTIAWKAINIYTQVFYLVADYNNRQGNYNMSNQQLPTADQQRDLGIIITKDLKCQKQSENSCKTATWVLGFIARNLRSKNKELILPLFNSLIRPHANMDGILVATIKTIFNLIKFKRFREVHQSWFLKSESTATTSESRTLISSAL